MADDVIELTEVNGVYVQASDTPKTVPHKPKPQMPHKTRPAADRRNTVTFTHTCPPKNQSAPLNEFIDGARECLSLFEHIMKRMK